MSPATPFRSSPSQISPAPASPSPVSPTPPRAAEQPTTLALVTAALVDGTLDERTALLYRLYALFGDRRLPEAYRGAWFEDALALDLAREGLARLSAAEQAEVVPFLVRPTSPQSIWAPASTAFTLAAAPMTAVGCQDGFMREQVSPTIPVVVWGQCGAVRPESAVLAQVGEVVQYMADLWEPMTSLMGEPIGDQNDASDVITDSPEAGDGLLDIYLIDASVSAHGRGVTIPSGAWAAAPASPPFIGPAGAEASSTYIIIDGGGPSGADLKATVAHEFFHSLQAGHNRTGTYWDTSGGPVFYWFVEASAAWAEHEFVPAARPSIAYPRFTKVLQSSPLPLSTADGRNEFASFAWPLFMRQEEGATSIGAAWTGMEGKSGYNQLQAALDAELSFSGRFHEFAVRIFNEDLEPGDPVRPRFQALDRGFPLDTPDDPRASYNNPVFADATLPGFRAELPSLWSSYTELVPEDDVHQLTLDFGGLSPSTALDVDLLLLLDDGWQRRRVLLIGPTTICEVEKAIVVLSNHDQRLNAEVSGSWTARGVSDACPEQLVGDLTAHYRQTYLDPQGTEHMQTGDLTLHLEVAANSFGSLFAARGSSYHYVIEGDPVMPCPADDQSGTLGLPPGWAPEALADPAATGAVNIGGGGEGATEIMIDLNIPVGCGWIASFPFIKGTDGTWRHDAVVPTTETASGTKESQSHGTISEP